MTEVVKTHDDDMTHANTQNSASREYLASQASHTMIVPGELGGNILFASPAGLVWEPGSVLSADCYIMSDCVVSCGSVSLYH